MTTPDDLRRWINDAWEHGFDAETSLDIAHCDQVALIGLFADSLEEILSAARSMESTVAAWLRETKGRDDVGAALASMAAGRLSRAVKEIE